MRVVAAYDRSVIWTGCGAAEVGDTMYVNSGSLPGRPSGHDLYAFDMDGFSLAGTPQNTPAPRVVYSRVSKVPLDLDSHGVALTKHKRYLWVNDRIQNDVTVVDTTSETVVGSFSLVGPLWAHAAVGRPCCVRRHAGRRGDPGDEGRQDRRAPGHRPPP